MEPASSRNPDDPTEVDGPPGSGGEPEIDSLWAALRDNFPAGSPVARHWAETRSALLASADSGLAFSLWSRWLELRAEEGETDELLRRWDESSAFRAGFVAIAGASPALGNLLLTSWREFRPEAWQSGWETRSTLERRLSQKVQGASDREFPDVVRAFQRLELIRIAYLDLVQNVAVDRITQQISLLADVTIEACYRKALEQLARRRGFALPQKGFTIFALGKLGGNELNYSSDVDLNFVYDDAAPILATLEGKPVTDVLEVERFFTNVAEKLVDLVTAFTDRGQLYRLDARLRPEGSSGRLVWSARASVDYYYSVGRAWERQALIRLRPIAGDLELAARFQRELDPFIFPANLLPEEIAEIRGLKLQMEKMAEDRGPSEDQIKIGRGGIRDVEYIVQFLQLVKASRAPNLKKANLFQALELLDAEGLLKPEETDILRRGYRFLRKVEHRIQMAHLRQTHRLPEDAAELLRLARSLGFVTPESFRGRLKRHAAQIRRVFRLLFEEPTSPRGSVDLPSLLQLPLELGADDGARQLAAFGFNDPREAFLRLHSLATGQERSTLAATRTKEVFSGIVARLLRELSRQPEPDRALRNFEECVRTLGARSVFFQLLSESERSLQLFVEISARSTLLVERLRAYPDLFDELVDALATGYEFTGESLLGEVDRLFRTSGSFRADIFRLKHLHLLLLAVQDLERMDNLSATLLHIAELNEAVLHAVLRATEKETRARFGDWAGPPSEYLVLGLGKLGGQEMNYKSDVDLVILYEGESRTTGGQTTQEYFERFAQLALAEAGVADSFGPLLKVDLRLRPLGGHNSLAISLGAWKQYFLGETACTWERQAFLRARPVAGSKALAEDAMRFIRGELPVGGSGGPRSVGQVQADVREMRSRLEAHAKPGDLKRGRGGIVDVEFIVQTLQLCHGKEHPGILTPNTAAGLQRLIQAGLLGPSEGSSLLTAYQFLRWIENRISLVGEAGQSLTTLASEDLESLVQKIGYKASGEESALAIFQGELDYYRRVNRRELERVLGGP